MSSAIPTFWPTMARCPHCKRFTKRGLINMVKHMDDCPSVIIIPSKEKTSKKDFFKGIKPHPIVLGSEGIKEFEKMLNEYSDKNIVDLIKEDMKTTEIEFFLGDKSLGLYDIKEMSNHLDRALVAFKFNIGDFDKYMLRPDSKETSGAERIKKYPGRVPGEYMIDDTTYQFCRNGFIEHWKIIKK